MPLSTPALAAALLLLAAAVTIVLAVRLAQAPHSERFSPPPAAQDSLFVSVASFRDRQCSPTLKLLFDRAKHPDRLRIGICQQNSTSAPDEECLAGLTPAQRAQCRVLTVHSSEASGPTTARAAIVNALYKNEATFVMIDSHMIPCKHWDTLVEADLERARKQSPRGAAISTYPLAHGSNPKDGVPQLTSARFNERPPAGDGIFTQKALIRPAPAPGAPLVQQPFIAAGFYCCNRAVMSKVPWGDGFEGLFVGEEMLLAARLFTHGVNVYAPSRNAFTHHYERKGEKKVWDDSATRRRFKADQRRSQAVVRGLLGLPDGTPPPAGYRFGMGTARPLSDWWRFANVQA